MTDPVVIENVVLRGADLNIVWSRWKAINRVNNLRLLPIAIGFLISSAVLSSLIDPSLVETVMLMGPILIGSYVFLWVTNVVLMGAYKKAYAATPVGREPCTFQFDADGMRQTMPRGETFFRWSAFVDVVQDGRGFRFWMTPFSAVFIPSRYVSADNAEALRRLLDDALQRGEIAGL